MDDINQMRDELASAQAVMGDDRTMPGELAPFTDLDEPFTYYHGTTSVFDEFSDSFLGGHTRNKASLGFYFSRSSEAASSLAMRPGGSVIPANLTLENPYEMSVADVPNEENEAKSLREYLKGQGHDGIIIHSMDNNPEYDQYVVFQHEQIKSAITGQQMAEGGDVPSEVPDIKKNEPINPFLWSGFQGLAGAGIGAFAGAMYAFGGEYADMVAWSALMPTAISVYEGYKGMTSRQRKKHADPILEEMAEDAARLRRPERFAEGGDVHKEYQSLSAELEGLQNEYDNADAEKRKEIWARIQSKSERAAELAKQIDKRRREDLGMGDDFEPPVEWNPDDNDPDEPDHGGPDTRPRPHSPRPSPVEADYSMAFAQGGEVPVMLEPGEKVTPPSGEKEWEVPVLEGKPESGDVVPAMLEPGTHVTPKDQFASEQSIPHMAHGGDVARPSERMNDVFDSEREVIGRDDMSELADAIRKLTETVTKVTDEMEKSNRTTPSESPSPGKVRSTTFDPAKAKERFGKPPGGGGAKSAEMLEAFARTMAAAAV